MRRRDFALAVLVAGAVARLLPAAVANAQGPVLPGLPPLPISGPVLPPVPSTTSPLATLPPVLTAPAPAQPPASASSGLPGTAVQPAVTAGTSAVTTAVSAAAQPVAGAVGNTATTVTTATAPITTAVAPASAVVSTVTTAVPTAPITTVIAAAAPIESAVQQVVAPAATTIASALQPVVAAVAPAIRATLPIVQPVLSQVPAVAEALQQVTATVPAVAPVTETVTNLVQTVAAPLVPAATQTVSNVVQENAPVPPALPAIVGSPVDDFVNQFDSTTGALNGQRQQVSTEIPMANAGAAYGPTIVALAPLPVLSPDSSAGVATSAFAPEVTPRPSEDRIIFELASVSGSQAVADRAPTATFEAVGTLATAFSEAITTSYIQPAVYTGTGRIDATPSRAIANSPAPVAPADADSDALGATAITTTATATAISLPVETTAIPFTAGATSPVPDGSAGTSAGHGGTPLALLIAALALLVAGLRFPAVRWAHRGPTSLSYAPITPPG